jgi:lipopolysaccharide exporter
MRRSLAWATVAVVSSRAIGFVSLLVLTHLLAPDQFGTVAAITTFLALIQLGSDLGMQATVVYEQEQGVSERIHVAFTLNLVLAAAVTVAAMIVAPWVAAFFRVEGATDLFRLASLNLLLFGIGNIHDGLLLREMRFDRRVRPQIVLGAVQAIVSISLAFAGLGATAMVIGSLAGTAAWAAMLWAITDFRPRPVWRPAVMRSMIGYGGGAAGLEVIAVITSRADVLVVGRMLGDHALGLYTVAFRVPEILLSNVAWTLSSVAFPALSKLRQERGDDISAAVAKIVGLLALYALPVAVMLALLAGAIVEVLLPPEWAPAGPVLAAVALTAGIDVVLFPLGDAGKAAGKQGTLLLINVLHLPMMIGTMAFAARWGITGVAISGIATMVLFAGMFLIWARWSVGLKLTTIARELRPALAATAGTAIALETLRAAWPHGHAWPLLIIGGLVAVSGATLGLRLLAPGALTSVVREIGWRRAPRPVPAGDVE